MPITAQRIQLPPGTVGYQKKFGVPVFDEDNVPLNLDGLTITARGRNPVGTVAIVLTAAQRTPGGHKLDVTVTAAQMTTGGVGEWLVDVYVNSEPLWHGRYSFIAEPKETEA